MSILSNNFLTNRADYITLWNVKVVITPLNGDIRGRKKSWSGLDGAIDLVRLDGWKNSRSCKKSFLDL
jgi:hypothetical protein